MARSVYFFRSPTKTSQSPWIFRFNLVHAVRFLKCTGLSQSLQQSQPIQATIRSTANLNSPAKHTDYKFSRYQLLELRARTPVSRNFFLSLNDLYILRTRLVRAEVTTKQRLRRIPVLFGREIERTTQFYYSDQKLPYHHNVNKRSNLGSNANNLIAVHRTSLKSLEICRTHEVPYPPFKDKLTFAEEMGSYFIEKTVNIQAKLDNMASGLSSLPPSSNSRLRPCSIMDSFHSCLKMICAS